MKCCCNKKAEAQEPEVTPQELTAEVDEVNPDPESMESRG